MGLEPAAAFENYVLYTPQILYNNLGGEVYHVPLFFHVRPADQPTVAAAARCRDNVGDPWSDRFSAGSETQNSFLIKATAFSGM
jgi:hypothetical protein